MGALLAAAGADDEELFQYGMDDAEFRLAQEVYGLAAHDVNSIISANDGMHTGPIWQKCGVQQRPKQEVRVCVVNDRVRELASA